MTLHTLVLAAIGLFELSSACLNLPDRLRPLDYPAETTFELKDDDYD